jgi:hypothetical protein
MTDDNSGNDEGHPTDSATRSVSPAGECIDSPTDGGTIIEVSDMNGDNYGLLIKWDEAAWMFATKPNYVDLDYNL